MTEGIKHDAGKLPMHLIPPEAVFALASVLKFGADKYGERNWEKGMSWSRLFGAAMRHLWSWWRMEDKDSETGFSHLWHAMACIAFLLTYEERADFGNDDRPIN
jgi:hypothetical protein